MEIRAAAPPPTPLKMATIWGMAVIFTMRAAGTAIAAPRTMATRVRIRFSGVGPHLWVGEGDPDRHDAAAAAERLPLRACLGELSPFRARMKPMAASR